MTLTEQQRRAVESEARDVLVVAGAGSGKTRVLTERIRYLIEQKGVSPASMLALTFTRKAAAELLGRLARSLTGIDDPKSTGMLIGTFHSVALGILKVHGDKLGLIGPEIEVLDPDDADAVLEQSARDLGYLKDKRWLNRMTGEKVKQYREAQYSSRELPWLKEHDEGPYKRLFQQYRTTLMTLNCLDFGLILMECRRLLTTNPDVLAIYRDQIKHVLVDELQDSDATQYDLHDFFAPPATFFGVGDTRQAIYGFRGARPDLMLERHPGAEVVNLTDCFRCDKAIVIAANDLIAVNAEPMTEPLTWVTGKKGKVASFPGRSEHVAVTLNLLHWQAGYAWRDMVVLSGTHRRLTTIEDRCRESGVPCRRVGATFSLFDTEEFKTLHRILRLIANPQDDIAFLGLTEELGLDAGALSGLRTKAHKNSWPLWRAWIERGPAPSATTLGITMSLIEPFQPVDQILHQLGGEGCFSLDGPTVEYWRCLYQGKRLADALLQHALRDQQDDLCTDDVVQLMTIHAAKGLEWPLVLIANLNEGDMPRSRAIKEGQEKEERRLAYVAFTRAKETLLLHYRRPEDQDADRMPQAPSRFLAESGVKL